jgi:hypothetical protein
LIMPTLTASTSLLSALFSSSSTTSSKLDARALSDSVDLPIYWPSATSKGFCFLDDETLHRF